jgi:hypothetical protein
MHNLLTIIQPRLSLFINSMVGKLDPKSDERSLQVIKILDFYYSYLTKGSPAFAQPESLQQVISKILHSIE